jgi:peptidyl-dipeptidase A
LKEDEGAAPGVGARPVAAGAAPRLRPRDYGLSGRLVCTLHRFGRAGVPRLHRSRERIGRPARRDRTRERGTEQDRARCHTAHPAVASRTMAKPLPLLLALVALSCSKSEPRATADGKTPPPSGDESKVVKVDTKSPGGPTPPGLAKPSAPSAEEAEKFAVDVDKNLRELWTQSAEAEWRKQTDITDENEKLAAEATAKVMAYETKVIKEAVKFDKSEAKPETKRQIQLLKLTSTLPAPDDDTKRKELAEIVAKLDGMYGKGKWCDESGKTCQDLGELSQVMADDRDWAKQLEAWQRWHTVSPPMRPLYQRLVELGNEGAKDIGFKDVGELWRSRYDMTPDAFEQEMERLWTQVKPLYEQLHCHVRAELAEKYPDKMKAEGPIPAHILGNMWAQDWANLYPMLEPYPGEASIDITKALKKKKVDEIQMVKMGEAFFTSMGLNPLPETFWERSLFKKPEGREVVCHASAWDVGFNNDLRIKMCIKVDHEDFVTIHHELGHDYYYNNYYQLPVLFQSGAHDGFHEAIGDAIALSITPSYLKEVGLLSEVSDNDKGVINKQMQDALQKIAFLPFGKLIDQWRWDVFSGKTKPETYNADWWKLRESYQGVSAPSERSEADFDPGAKYHIPGNTPYARYFLAHIIQFQFHKAMCEAAGHTGPLHTCSVFNSKDAGKKLQAMLALGASKPWPEALEQLAGTREMDGAALIEYFDPLMKYLEEQNQGRTCGW